MMYQMVNTAWDLLECAFMVVAEVILLAMPLRRRSAQWDTVSTRCMVNSAKLECFPNIYF